MLLHGFKQSFIGKLLAVQMIVMQPVSFHDINRKQFPDDNYFFTECIITFVGNHNAVIPQK